LLWIEAGKCYGSSLNLVLLKELFYIVPFVKNLFDEKDKVDKQYTSLLEDVKKWIHTIENRVLEHTMAMAKLEESCEEQIN
jgi:hypothetical protein